MVSAMHQMDAHEKWRDTASHTQFHFEDKVMFLNILFQSIECIFNRVYV